MSGLDEAAAHVAWVKSYVATMTADNWRDMRLLIERQAGELERALATTTSVGSEPVGWIVERKDRDGRPTYCLPLLRGREEMARYRKNNPDEQLAALYASPISDREKIIEAREGLRELMLKQPTTGLRKTYSDGFAMGLCVGIETLDALAALAALKAQP